MTIVIPTAFRKFTQGQGEVQVSGDNVLAAVEDLVRLHPSLRDALFDDSGNLVSFVGIFVDGQNIRDLQNETTALRETDEILLVPAIAGG